MDTMISTDMVNTEDMATELPFFTVAVTVKEGGDEEDQFIPVQASSIEGVPAAFVAQEVYRNDWKFNHPAEDQHRLALSLAPGFLSRHAPDGFEGATFREVVNNPAEAREFTIGFITEGVIED